MSTASGEVTTPGARPAEQPQTDEPLRRGRFSATRAGEGGWRVIDELAAFDDSARVVAFVRDLGSEVDVLWVRGSLDSPGRLPSVEQALAVIATSVRGD